MKKKIFLEFVGLAAVFGLIWAIFTYFPIFDKDTSLDFPVAKEEKLGDLLVENYLEGTEQIASSRLDTALFLIHKRLRSNIGITEYDYDIYVVKEEQVNAFALPGGNIVIFKGLIDFTQSPEELAGVLAHEIGHIENKHVVKRLVQRLGVGLLFSVFTGSDPVLVTEILQTVLSATFDRSQEREADQYAMDLLVKSGISPRVIASFFRRLNDKFGSYDESLAILSTHPHNNARIRASLKYELPDTFEARNLNINWERIQKTINEPKDTTSISPSTKNIDSDE